MLLSNIPLLVVVLAAAAHCKPKKSGEDYDDVPELSWPEKYYIEVTKFEIASGLVEDIKVWKSKTQSRVEYNHGAVKEFITKGKGRRGYKYEIHPETYGEDSVNQLKCKKSRRNFFSDDGPTDILPNPDSYEYMGQEHMGSQVCDTFYLESVGEDVDFKETVWATYDEEVKSFIPVRYEVKQYNTWLGSVDRHDIWDFENFNEDIEDSVFDADKYCNEDNTIELDVHEEVVTKHLELIDPDNEEHVDHVFNTFKSKFSKTYTHKDEHAMRRRIFQNKLRFIKSTNRKNLGYTLAVNRFSDLTRAEMIRRHTGLKKRPEGKSGETFPYNIEQLADAADTLPKEYDARMEGLVTPVMNQEDCGSCWTYGTTSAIEGALARSNGGTLIKLSNQALIDCAWEFDAFGCDGGSDTAAYEWVKKYGLPKLSEYGTYANHDGYCHIANMTETYHIKSFVDVTPNSVQALKVALVNHGPLSVSIDATDAFSLYSGGVFYDVTCDSKELNHEVTLVGYGEQYGETFWIVKNSYGPEWGIDGYMHIAAKDNNCGIMTEPTYVLF